MKFYYRPTLTLSADTGEPTAVLRPEIPVRIRGPRGQGHYVALVDTGADNSVVPVRIADDLGIDLHPSTGPDLVTLGGEKLPVHIGEIEIEVGDAEESVRWLAAVHFFDFASAEHETLVFGHAGFLDYFTAVFDGLWATLTLTPNATLPRL